MFWEIYKFEIKYWLNRPMVYVFFFVYFLMMLGAVCSDQVQLGEAVGNLKRNAPYILQFHYAIMVVLGMMSTTAFVQAATLRDFNHNAHQLIFSTPMGKLPYLAGRFFGAFTIAVVPFLSVSAASLIAPHIAPVFDWMPAERFQAVNWQAHFNALTLFVLPNTLFISAIVFAIAALTRSTMLSFIGIILVLVLWGISGSMMDGLETERYVLLTDPLGMRPFSLLTQYWTVADKNAMSLSWANADIAINRLIWITISLVLMGITAWRFSFAERRARRKSKQVVAPKDTTFDFGFNQGGLPSVTQRYGFTTLLGQLWAETKSNFNYIVKGTAFIVILIAGTINMIASMEFAQTAFGLARLPVTYSLVDQIRGSMSIFTLAVLVFYTGSLVWRERDAKLDQIYDSTPHATAISFFSKTIAMIAALAVVQVICIVVGVVTQAMLGFNKFDLNVYLVELGLIELTSYTVLVVISIFIHTILNNKYIGYFVFLVAAISMTMAKNVFHISTNMIGMGDMPFYIYSDMNGYGPFVKSLVWFSLYWLLLAGVLALVTILFWQRGVTTALREKLSIARMSFRGNVRTVGLVAIVLFIACGGWVYYNTEVLNSYDVNYINEKQQAEYERKYKQYQHHAQPTITDVKFDIALYPHQRAMKASGKLVVENRTAEPIDSLFFTFNETTECTLQLEAEMLLDDQETHFQIHHLDQTLLPGQQMTIGFTADYESKGFENEISVTEIVQNGTFFNNTDIFPMIGYIPEGELVDRTDRRRQKLPERQRMPELTKNCSASCARPYVPNAHWVTMETTISTSADQIAVAPGSLIKEWTEGERNYFTYKLDHPSAYFASFISADYTVVTEKWKDVDLEVYYDEQHPFNVENMMRSLRRSLEYYTENFGPYYHKQARIIEFPRYASFAQAFAGTMPYSESIGFIADIDPDNDIDMVFYVVAHEMGHQWWAHQVLGAYMQGATLLSETLSQYSALMVMEAEYGRDRMGKFLRYEKDTYLESRSGEIIGESPLSKVEDQSYVHYNKGSLAMYHLKELIGADSVNRALQRLIDSFAYVPDVYPNSYALMDQLRRVTPDSLQTTLAQLFDDIILFDNRLVDASYTDQGSGSFEVEMKFSSEKFRSDALGEETSIPMDDWIEVAVFAEPDSTHKDGRMIASRKVHVTSDTTILKIEVAETPFAAAVDPLNYIVDRIADDNRKEVRKLE